MDDMPKIGCVGHDCDACLARGWKSIESAPKDGRSVLLLNSGKHVVIGRFENGWRKHDYAFREPLWTYADVTHWMPLPSPPEPT